jgi:hypothetical protein
MIERLITLRELADRLHYEGAIASAAYGAASRSTACNCSNAMAGQLSRPSNCTKNCFGECKRAQHP